VPAGVIHPPATMDRWSDRDPEGEASEPGAVGATLPQENDANVERVRAGDESAGWPPGEPPEEGNLIRGCGMEQARAARGGASRREREKRCGRKAGGVGKPQAHRTPRAHVAKEAKNSTGGARRVRAASR